MSNEKSRTIHVVDDDEGVRDSMRALLESFGFRARTFASAVEFLDVPAGEAADCLLLDLNMPGVTGLELLESLRARDIQTPAIVVTASDEKLSRRMVQAGVLAVLRKPVADGELVRTIEQACARNTCF